MSADPVALVTRWFEEVWNQKREATIDELVNADSVCYLPEGAMRGPEEFKARQFHPFIAAFPDLRVTVDDIICAGDQVVVRWSATGTHSADGLGFEKTDRRVTFQGMSWIRVQDGKMVEGWQCSNINEVVQSLATD